MQEVPLTFVVTFAIHWTSIVLNTLHSFSSIFSKVGRLLNWLLHLREAGQISCVEILHIMVQVLLPLKLLVVNGPHLRLHHGVQSSSPGHCTNDLSTEDNTEFLKINSQNL